MIINISRTKDFLLCKQKAFNRYHRRLDSQPTMNMAGGSAFHKAVAVGLASRDWQKAADELMATFNEEMRVAVPLPEEVPLWQRQEELLRAMLSQYRVNYEAESYQVVQPECEFLVDVPNSHHNCIWLHHLERISPGILEDHKGPPKPQAILERRVESPHSQADPNCFCWQPHKLAGRADALVMWKGFLWLLEHKTTSILGEQFWNEWLLNIQPTGYLWGVGRALGMTPKGFVINAIYRPSENQVRSYNDRRKYGPDKSAVDYIKFERQAFTRTDEDLANFEEEIRDTCNEWEARILSGKWGKSNVQGACMLYNRLCDFHPVCLSHGSPESLDAFTQRAEDYVDVHMRELLR